MIGVPIHAALWALLSIGLAALYFWKHQYVVRAAHWLRKLVEEGGEPSLRRSAFAFALVSTVTILFLSCKWPEIVTDQVVGAMDKIFLFVGAAWAGRGAIEDVAELIKSSGSANALRATNGSGMNDAGANEADSRGSLLGRKE